MVFMVRGGSSKGPEPTRVIGAPRLSEGCAVVGYFYYFARRSLMMSLMISWRGEPPHQCHRKEEEDEEEEEKEEKEEMMKIITIIL